MRYILSIILLTIILVGTSVLASDVSLKTTQSEYTFLAGEEARVPIVVESTFTSTNVGNLAYTLTRKEAQGGFSFSQSSTQSQSFPISPGSSENAISLSSQEPADYEVSLSLQYRDDGHDFSANLPAFQVHFINNQSPSQGQGLSTNVGQNSPDRSPLTSTTSEVKQNPPGQAQDPFNEMEQQMNAMRQQNQQLIQQAISSQGMQPSGPGQQSSAQNAQQALQNNQMNTQSSSLQQQLAQEAEQKKKDQQELSQNLAQDPLMKKMAQELNQAGYQKKEGAVSAQGKGAGSIEFSFEDKTGKSVNVQGSLQNNSVQQLTAHSDESIPVPQELADDSRYTNEKSALAKSGYNEAGGSEILTQNETRIEQQFKNSEGKNATISSIIRNGTVEEVTVKKDEEVPLGWYLGIILLIILICLCIWAGYRYYQRPGISPEERSAEVVKEPVDILNETTRMLTEAEKKFAAGRVKDGYSRAGQALRFFISYSYGSGGAETSEEIVSIARKSGIPHEEVQNILTRCNLVEFAKNKGNAEEFAEIIANIRMVIQEHQS
ncbi:MAG: hypothetical protein V1862_00920 [Methanobacteriota archaeon]